MTSFSDLEFGPHSAGVGGVQATLFFPNGYGVSVVRTPYSYGGLDGLYELAVLVGTAQKWTLTYETPVTDDVLGFLSENDVTEAMQRVEALPAKGD